MLPKRTDYMREYRRKQYKEFPEKSRKSRSKKWARDRYGFTFEEVELYDEHCCRAGKIRELLREINDPEIAKVICDEFIHQPQVAAELDRDWVLRDGRHRRHCASEVAAELGRY